MLIFTHAVPKERKVTIGPKLLQQFPKGSLQREIGLELLESGNDMERLCLFGGIMARGEVPVRVEPAIRLAE